MIRKLLIGMAVFVVVAFGAVKIYERATGTSVIVSLGAPFWIPVSSDTAFLSKGVRAGLSDPIPQVTAGAFEWRRVQDGFDVTEVPVMAGDEELDRILFARIDSGKFRFAVHNDKSGSKRIDDWQRETGAALIVNGSYYGPDGLPSTPTLSDGVSLGPETYDATHGVFADGSAGARFVDVRNTDWRAAFIGAKDGFVSYPLLVTPSGTHRTPRDSNWLANRSFLAMDHKGRVLVGTTKDGFFSLHRLAEFLTQAPLGIRVALNLDGGPVACQSIDLEGFQRQHCGDWELQVSEDGAQLLPPMRFLRKPVMPIAIAVYPRN